MEYDILLFLDIIQNEGCLYIDETEMDGERSHFYLSRNGKKRVMINISDETMTRVTASDLLVQLELPDLIDRLFPVTPLNKISTSK